MCGCCTVLVNARAVRAACISPACATTPTCGLSRSSGVDAALDAVQQAFVDAGALQCGFCTPGFVLMTRQLLDEIPDPDEDDIRHYLSGNLCRCAAYPEIIEAVKLAARKRRNS